MIILYGPLVLTGPKGPFFSIQNILEGLQYGFKYNKKNSCLENETIFEKVYAELLVSLQ